MTRVRDYIFKVISALVIEKLVRKGCDAYFAYLHDTSCLGSIVEEIRTVRSLSDAVPEEFPGLPLDREVEFKIELLLRTAPMSITPYRMAPKELKELKMQL